MKHEVGDVVRVRELTTEEKRPNNPNRNHPGYDDKMDVFLGRIAVITKIDQNNWYRLSTGQDDCESWVWMEGWLEKMEIYFHLEELRWW